MAQQPNISSELYISQCLTLCNKLTNQQFQEQHIALNPDANTY